ncbi:MAG: hypothetical protein RBT39_00045 [Azoarcus sp.]|nr:hypothetical protein [Azoarcus sp.]MDD2874348.1 hypothetical protein [Azoarcus sp.]MDX9835938.1 hypothetical protein [Azoarcus sp.]
MNSSTAAVSVPEEADEQRRYHRVREIFDEASVLIAPFFARESRWANSTLDHLAYRVVRDRYPELSAAEVHVLVVACSRLYADT